jgi:hypothetical protein
MNRRIIWIALLSLLPLVSIAAVNAAPIWETFGMYPWVNFKITGSGLHIASDPLFDSTIVNTIPPFDPSATTLLEGWVTFVCATDQPTLNNAPKGFDFSITVIDLPRGRYTVKAYPTTAFPPPPDPPYPSDDLGNPPYVLGTLKVGGKGEGELQGFYDLPAGSYAWRITVELDGTPILETHWIDAADFLVIS